MFLIRGEKMFYDNGIIIQQLDNPMNFRFSFEYQGVNAYHQYPLCGITDKECIELTKEVFSKKTEDGMYEQTEFISSMDLFKRYTDACKKQKIPIRALYIKSNYPFEIWTEQRLPMKFLGYEYLEIPFDLQIITDLDLNSKFTAFKKRLNEFGVFNTLPDVLTFKAEYDKKYLEGKVGDGDYDAYICCIYEILMV